MIMRAKVLSYPTVHPGRTTYEYFLVAGLYALMGVGIVGTIVGTVGTIATRL